MKTTKLALLDTETQKYHRRFRIYNRSFLDDAYPEGLTITDPPYNVNYHYNSYKDKLSTAKYIEMLSHIKGPKVVIHYPEPSMNLFHEIWGDVSKVVTWVYNSNNPREFRLISFFGLKPNFRLYSQPYKNLGDKRIQKLIAEGNHCRLSDWWQINQVKNTSREKRNHPCQIPGEVIRRIIAISGYEGNTIIDPFLGSGTVGGMAIEMGYDFVGYEIDEKYFRVARDYLRKASLKARTAEYAARNMADRFSKAA
jgi:DNA modification methylase